MMRKLWLILIFSIILTGIASAQDKTSAASSVQAAAAAVAEPPFDFAAADKELNKIERLLSSGKVSGKETSAYLKSLNDIQNAINQSRAQNAENFDNVQKKIAALGRSEEHTSELLLTARKNRPTLPNSARNSTAKPTLINL